MDAGSSASAPLGGAINSQPVVKTASPVNGATLAFDDNAIDQTYYLTPAGLIAGATITFPSNANSRIGQKLTIRSTATITAVTIGGAGTVQGAALATLTGGTSVFFEKVAANTWFAHII